MNVTFAILGFGGGEVLIVVIAVLVLFGAKKIPEFARGLGKGISEFKKASSEVSNELQNAIDTPAPAAKPGPQPAATAPQGAAKPGDAGVPQTKVI